MANVCFWSTALTIKKGQLRVNDDSANIGMEMKKPCMEHICHDVDIQVYITYTGRRFR